MGADMTFLLLGLALFLRAHTYSITMTRERRAALIGRYGERGFKGAISIASLIGLALIVYGFGVYRADGYIAVWEPPTWTRHLSILLVWPAFIALTAAYSPAGKIKGALKHPMLVGVKLWALAHLIANGDLGSMLLFGTLLGYAVLDRIAVKKRGDFGPGPAPFGKGDVIALIAGTALYVALLLLHPLLIGVSVIGRVT